MITSVNKQIHQIVLDELNANTKGVIFDGNFMFKFWQQPSARTQEFAILRTQDNTLELANDNVVPVVNVENVEIPFNEKNKRSDWEATYFISIKIPPQLDLAKNEIYEFDETDDRYQAMMEAYTELKKKLSVVSNGIKTSFKVREPQKRAIFKFEGNFYQVFALSFNVVKIEKGRFGNELSLYIGKYEDTNFGASEEYLIDVISANMIMGKTEHDDTPIRNYDTTSKGIKRNWELQVFANYNESEIENEILHEIMTFNSNINQRYYLKMVQEGSFANDYIGLITNGTIEFKNNAVERLNLTFKNIKGD